MRNTLGEETQVKTTVLNDRATRVEGISSLLAKETYLVMYELRLVNSTRASFSKSKYYRALKELNPKYKEVTDLLIKIVRTSRAKAKVDKNPELRISYNEALDLLKREYFGIDAETGYFYVDQLPDNFEDKYLKEFTRWVFVHVQK